VCLFQARVDDSTHTTLNTVVKLTLHASFEATSGQLPWSGAYFRNLGSLQRRLNPCLPSRRASRGLLAWCPHGVNYSRSFTGSSTTCSNCRGGASRGCQCQAASWNASPMPLDWRAVVLGGPWWSFRSYRPGYNFLASWMTNNTTASEASESMAFCRLNSDGTIFPLRMAKVKVPPVQKLRTYIQLVNRAN